MGEMPTPTISPPHEPSRRPKMLKEDLAVRDARRILPVPHVIRGKLVHGLDTVHHSRDAGVEFATPAIDPDALVWSRREPLPMLDTPIDEIMDFLVELGTRLNIDSNAHLQQACESMNRVSALGPRVLENIYRDMGFMFDKRLMQAEIAASIGDQARLDGWVSHSPIGAPNRMRAFPPRLVHIMAGNAPSVAALTIVRAALTKGVHLLKLASNDLFTPSAILATMAEIDADHPVTRSFSIAYWRGGDASIERLIYQPQYFDKLVVWGGESAVRNALNYVGPGFELISFDPKVSISMIGAEALATPESIAETARRGAADVMPFDQDACSASRYQFIEGETGAVDAYCAALAEELGKDHRYGNAQIEPTPATIREEVEVLRTLDPMYRVFGRADGRGLVVRSDEPVDFHPDRKTVNVVQVPSLEEAVAHVTVATQTVGIYPPNRKAGLRDALASAGAQRLVTLGKVISTDTFGGQPHDGIFPMHRMMKWIIDEGEDA
jgi:hypothetical protein